MKDKLYKFIQSRGGCASSVAIVGQLLNIRGARRDVAERIVRSMVKNMPLFMSDGLGNWYINPEEESRGANLNDVVFNLIEIRGNARELHQSSFLEIGLCPIKNGEIKQLLLYSAQKDCDSLQRTMPVEHETHSWPDVLANVLSVLEGGVLTGFHLVPIRNYLYSEALRCCGEYITLNELSLKKLIQRLYPQKKIRNFSELAGLLNISVLESDDMKVHLNNLANLFLAISEKFEDSGLDDLQKLLEFQLPKRKQIDLEGKKISPHFLEDIPESSGVYLMKDNCDQVVYVGKAINLKSRVTSYFYAREQLDLKLARIWDKIVDVEIVELGSELEACLEEQKLIKQLQPEINIQLQVHLQTQAREENQNLIIFLPAKRKGFVNLFCTNSSGKFSRLTLFQKRQVSRWVSDELRKMFFSSRKRKPKMDELEQSALIIRWFRKNRDQVSWLDMNGIADLEECLRLVEKYKQEKLGKKDRVIYV